MKIAICSSMAFAREMIVVKGQLESLGHVAYISDFVKDFLGKSEEEKVELNKKNVEQKDAIREFWNKIQNCDAILVLNLDRKGISNYIGGNALMEIGFAHVLQKKIFLMNAIPEISFYKAEIEGIKPIILHGNIGKIV